MKNLENFHNKIKEFLDKHSIEYKHMVFNNSCHSIEEASLAANEDKENFVKNVCMIDDKKNLIVAIVSGENRASTKRVAKALNINRPRLATSEEIYEKTGFVAGGIPSFSYDVIYLIDEKVLNKDYIITGGGSEYSLIKIKVEDMLTLNNGRICRVRK